MATLHSQYYMVSSRKFLETEMISCVGANPDLSSEAPRRGDEGSYGAVPMEWCGMGGPQGLPGVLSAPQPLLYLLCLLSLLQAARPSQVPRDQPQWALLERYCHAVLTLTDLSAIGRREAGGTAALSSAALLREGPGLAAPGNLVWRPEAARQLRDAMDAALLHSLLEANCSLALAEEMLLDGWGPSLDPEGPYSYCNTTLDQIGTCWPRSAAGALVERPCPEYFNGIKYNTTRNAYRECLENGTWASRINYSQCEPILDDKQRKYDLHYRIALVVNYLGHCVSVAALVAAFLLFLALRSIRCLRNVIHWNLITTFILRNVMWFLLQLVDHEVHESNEVWCRCITTIFNYFVVTNFFWMFVEGCYLHTAIVMTYSTERLRKWLFLFIGWCIPCPIIIAWAVGKLYYENEQCWFGKEPGDLVDYIYQGPIILVLLINFVFLFNIVRILMTKLRASTTSETIQYRKAVKATLVLLPLLGITYMLFFVNPGEDDLSQIVFIYFNSFLQSFQGFFVSVFYCFFNGEVRSAVRKRWHRWQDHHSLRVPVARAMSIPTSPTRISFHSIKQTAAVICMGAKENGLPLEYQERLKAIEPNDYKGKVSEEMEDIIKRGEQKLFRT
ncbi:Corticotropin-releasing factor receptor 2 [Sciurus carolinensis]|uniref:Corticotropin-releasing factor receptor 2 n=2 Tax=Euarchontoglires TaxID=314146 RepID=A0AA41MQ12_SCICA|nr:Corticotropin-releasing factor receptor 2 [Sciurus carolinensis]